MTGPYLDAGGAVFLAASDLVRMIAAELCLDCGGEVLILATVDARGSPHLGPAFAAHDPTCPIQRAVTNEQEGTQ